MYTVSCVHVGDSVESIFRCDLECVVTVPFSLLTISLTASQVADSLRSSYLLLPTGEIRTNTPSLKEWKGFLLPNEYPSNIKHYT